MKNRVAIFLTIFFLGVFFCAPANATNFYFDNEHAAIMQGDEFKLKAAIDADDKILNTIGGRLLISDEFFEVKEILSGESGINFWVQPPSKIGTDQIVFSGIVPGGFSGKLAIFSAVLKAKKTGVTKIFYIKPEAHLHDGKGTLDIVSASELKITVEPRAPKSEPLIVKIDDSEPPENFQPEIIEAIKTLGIKYALVFSTADKKSGIDYFEVMEQRTYKFFGLKFSSGKFVKAESPYYLGDQKLKSDIFVRAVDKRGNERLVRLPASSPISWYENRLIWGIILLLGLLLFAFFALYGNKFKNKKQNS